MEEREQDGKGGQIGKNEMKCTVDKMRHKEKVDGFIPSASFSLYNHFTFINNS